MHTTDRRYRALVSLTLLLSVAGVAWAAAPSTVPPRPDEFRGAGGGLVCISAAEAGKTPPDTYDNCLHIGAIRVHQSVAEVEALLGPAAKDLVDSSGIVHRVYLLPEVAGGSAYFVVTFHAGEAVAVQLTGTGAQEEYHLSSIRLGDAQERVVKVLGAAYSTSPVPRVEATLWSYTPWPVSFEIKAGRVYSMRVAVPGR